MNISHVSWAYDVILHPLISPKYVIDRLELSKSLHELIISYLYLHNVYLSQFICLKFKFAKKKIIRYAWNNETYSINRQ